MENANIEELRGKLKELHDKEAIINEILANASKDGSLDAHHQTFLDDLSRIYEMEQAIQKQIEAKEIDVSKNVVR